MQQVSLCDYCEEAKAFIQAGKPEKAISITRHILRHYPRHLESYRLLGQALLAVGNYQQAAQQFQRVLGADPEDVASRVGLAEFHRATGDPDKAISHMQRALETSPDDADLRGRLDRLASGPQRPASDTPEPLELTRAALGRIHAQGGLYAKAAQEFKAVLANNPDRLDIQTALAEVLWRAGRHLEAAEVCQRILKQSPNALKANLIAAVVWLANSQLGEAEPHLRLVQALDPENTVAQSLFGDKSPLPPVAVHIDRLGEDELEDIQLRPPPTPPAEAAPVSQPAEPVIDWTSQLHGEEVMATSDSERPDEEYELPDWLKGLGDDLLEEKDEQPVTPVPPEGDAQADEPMPGWLRNLVSHSQETGTSVEPLPAEPGDLPDWMHELRPEAAQPPSMESGTPDWLVAMAAGQPPEDVQPEPIPGPEPSAPTPPDSQAHPMDWLTQTEAPEEELTSMPDAGEPTATAEQGRALWEQLSTEAGETLAPEETGLAGVQGLPGEADWLEAPPAAGQPPLELPEIEPLQEPAMPPAEPAAGDTGLPAWLKDLQEAEALLEADAGRPAMPEPLDERKPSLLEPVSGMVEEWDVPDWLREIAAGEEVQPAESQPVAAAAPDLPEVEIDEAGLPDWLRDFEQPAVEEAPPAVVLESPETAAEPAPAADIGLATWEQLLAEEGVDLSTAQEAPPPEAVGMTAEEWLRSTADLIKAPSPPAAEQPSLELPEEPAVPLEEEQVGEAGPPAWLRDVGQPFEEEAQQPAAGTPPERPPESVPPLPTGVPSYQAGLPDWLRHIVAGEPATAEAGEPVTPAAKAEMPDWLRETQEPPAPVQPEVVPELPPEAIPETPEVPYVEVEQAELPEWLREPVAETPQPPEPAAEPSAGLPEWLTELETQEILLAESDFEEPVELETGEMPAWLGEIMAGEPPLSEEWAVPGVAELAEPETPAEQLPDWLRDYREREWQVAAEPAPEPVEPTPLPEAEAQPGVTPQPELPDWLMRLREGVPEEAHAPEPAQAPAAEFEALPAEAPLEAEAAPAVEMFPEPEVIQPEAVGPAWLGELVRAEEPLPEFEAVIEEEPAFPEAPAPPLEEYAELAREVPLAAPAEVEPEWVTAAVPAHIPAVEPLATRQLEALQVEELPKDPAVRLSMARAALNAGDWAEALTIYQTLVTSSDMLDSVIDNLQVGLRRHPDDPAGYALLGDACMKDGRLQEALHAYRTALTKL